MTSVSDRNFGLLIAYLVPGFTALLGVAHFSETVSAWLTGAATDGPTIGGFLYMTLASVAAGMTASAIRFHVIDRIHHWTGIRHPAWDFSKLQRSVAAYDVLIDIHYNYYKFHANGLVSLLVLYLARQSTLRHWSLGVEDVYFLLIAVVFFSTSRDNLRKYYTRVEKLLGTEDSALPEDSSGQIATE